MNDKIDNNSQKIKHITSIAILVACATALQILESPLPRLLPWLKIGLANVITLYAIIRLKKIDGILIAAMRTCLAALFFGSFLSPIHIISFSGAVTAAIVMTIIRFFFPKASICLISIFGAISSNISQLLVIQLLFSQNINIWIHSTLIIWVGIPAGLIVGKITYEMLERTEKLNQ